MKKFIVSLVMAFSGLAFLNAQHCGTSTTEQKKTNTQTVHTSNAMSFPVSGSCDMCKSKIEKAALSVTGVSAATWNPDAQMIVLQTDGKVSEKDIKKAISNVGYDAGDVKASDKAYNALPGCCKYR